jgi:hypothetical protein
VKRAAPINSAKDSLSVEVDTAGMSAPSCITPEAMLRNSSPPR